MSTHTPSRFASLGRFLLSWQAPAALGSLLLLGLLAAPAGAASRITNRVYVALILSSVLATAALLIGVIASYMIPRTPPSFAILATASAMFAASFLIRPRTRLPSAARQPEQADPNSL